MKKASMCSILENVRIATDTYRLLLDAVEIAAIARPGQFVHIKVPDDRSLLLRRPISISDTEPETGVLELIYQVVGMGTDLLSRAGAGKKLDTLGPLGNGFEKPADVRKAFVIGGGCGVAPLKLLVKQWADVEFTTFLGFKSQPYCYDLVRFEELSSRLYLATDDGSLGQAGVITNLADSILRDEHPDLIISCGPAPMLKAVQTLAEKYGIRCQISLEQRMGCGMGGCLVCVCAVHSAAGWQYKKVCTDGPVFWSREVILDDSKDGC